MKSGSQRIPVQCAKCKKSLAVPLDAVGKKVRCPGCMDVFKVPDVIPAGAIRDARPAPRNPAEAQTPSPDDPMYEALMGSGKKGKAPAGEGDDGFIPPSILKRTHRGRVVKKDEDVLLKVHEDEPDLESGFSDNLDEDDDSDATANAEIDEESIASWIEEDVNEALEEDQKRFEERLKELAPRPNEIEMDRAMQEEQTRASMQRLLNQRQNLAMGRTVPGAIPPAGEADSGERDGSGSQASGTQRIEGALDEPVDDDADTEEATLALQQQIEARARAGRLEAEATAALSGDPQRTATRDGTGTRQPTALMALDDIDLTHDAAEHVYPEDVLPRAPRPYLVVLTVSHHGVALAFDAQWLKHDRFRASIPVRCAVTGDDRREELYARPLLFLDQSSASIRSASEVEIGHGERLTEGLAVSELVATMKRIDHLPSPYDRPMPYYVTTSVADQHLDCTTQSRKDGGVTCRVLIPEPTVALEWLGRVNGTCGDEYHLLAQDVKDLSNDAFGNLPIRCRQRLEAWCDFAPMERFRQYFHDAEFPVADMGLAGLVVTNHRLFYKKYHRQGSVSLREDAKLTFSAEGNFASVLLENLDHRSRICTLRIEDLGPLTELLKPHPQIRIVRRV